MIRVDFNEITGKIKPMHGVGQPPYLGPSSSYMHYLKEAGIPYSRLHDVCGSYGGLNYVDIPNVFKDFSADENDPKSYDFAFTDVLMSMLAENNCEPVYRLGVTIENDINIKAYRIAPPESFEKWARVCEHIIRHYNEGWADGFHYSVKHWEIWNEPDNAQMWSGTPEEFYRLYYVTANHLKKCFGDSISVGGYGSSGFFSIKKGYDENGHIKNPKMWLDKAPTFFINFLEYISSPEHPAPLDFFSWHSYSDVGEIEKQHDYCRKYLKKYGFGTVDDFLNEWDPAHDMKLRNSSFSSANVLAVMLAMQKKGTAMMNYYDARIGTSDYSGLFDPNTTYPCKAYFSMMSFNQLYKLKNEVMTACDYENVYAGAAADGDKAVLLIANINNSAVEAELDIKGFDAESAEILLINDIYHYTPCGRELDGNKLVLDGNTCAEIRFSRKI